MPIQIPDIILPRIWVVGNETEAINDLLEHTSLEFATEYLQEKVIQIMAVEAIVAGVPGNLWCWVELSPVPSTVSAAYWAAIGGGGGLLPPVAPTIVVPTGVPASVHTLLLPWTIHSAYARLVVQTPIAPGLPAAFWQVQAMFSGKMP